MDGLVWFVVGWVVGSLGTAAAVGLCAWARDLDGSTGADGSTGPAVSTVVSTEAD
jgi:hypothetical protein